MNTLVTFLNVTSAIWLIWVTVSGICVFIKANRLKREYKSVKLIINDTSFVLTFISIAWLITQAIT